MTNGILLFSGAILVTLTLTLTPSVDAAPMCVAKEWEGGQAMMTGYVRGREKNSTRSMTLVRYSAVQQKIFAEELPMFSPQRKTTLFDYPGKTLYTVTYDSSGTPQCTKTPLTVPFQEQCVPEGATITAVNTRYGAGNYVAKGWEAKGVQGDITYHVTFSNNKLPMFEELYGTKDGYAFFQNLYFYNATVTNFDPNSFPVPDSCK